mgnify:CR=1 FL=1
MNLYVWYRVSRDDADTETAVRGMMARVACRTGIAGQLLKKRDEPRLWMEVYSGIADAEAFARALAEKVNAYDIDMFLDGERRPEWFIPETQITAACAA